MSKDLAVFKLSETDDEFDLVYEMSEVNTDINGERYEVVTQTLADDDFYQGLNMCTVIKRVSDGKLFGFHWWDDISKHGEAYVESNGEEHGYEGYCEVEDDWDTFVSFYVFETVEKWTYEGYRVAN